MNDLSIIDCKDCKHCLLKRLTKQCKEFSVMCYQCLEHPILIPKNLVCSTESCYGFQPLEN